MYSQMKFHRLGVPKLTNSMPKKSANDYYNDRFHLLAISSCVIALISVLTLTISLPLLYSHIELEHSNIWAKSEKFKVNSNRVWTLLQSSAVNEQRNKRSPSAESGQSGCACSMLICPQGPPGPAGTPGQDTPPGQPGNPGESGVDGMDIVVESELDFPCIVCPGGPPGQRGQQGERGMSGIIGPRGEEGIPGKEGPPGSQGSVGPRGPFGPKGKTGLVGIRGDQVVAGVGVKGMKGRPGSAGQMGPNGLPGSMLVGQPGTMGEQGSSGQMGEAGRPGEAGDAGQPGEAGMPSSYCPADCGVSHIKIPGFEKMQDEVKSEVKTNKETTPNYEMPKTNGRLQQGKGRVKLLAFTEGDAEIRRHPTGGYYREREMIG